MDKWVDQDVFHLIELVRCYHPDLIIEDQLGPGAEKRHCEVYEQIGKNLGRLADDVRVKLGLLKKQYLTISELKQLDDSVIEWTFYDEMESLYTVQTEDLIEILEEPPPPKIIKLIRPSDDKQIIRAKPDSPKSMPLKVVKIIQNSVFKSTPVKQQEPEKVETEKEWSSTDIYHLLFTMNLKKDSLLNGTHESRVEFVEELMKKFEISALQIWNEYKSLLETYKINKNKQIASDGDFECPWAYFAIMDSIYKDKDPEAIEDDFAILMEAYENEQKAKELAAAQQRRRTRPQHGYKFRDGNGSAFMVEEGVQTETTTYKTLLDMDQEEQKEAIMNGLKNALDIIKGRSDEYELLGEFLAKEMKNLPTAEMRQSLKARILENIIKVSKNDL